MFFTTVETTGCPFKNPVPQHYLPGSSTLTDFTGSIPGLTLDWDNRLVNFTKSTPFNATDGTPFALFVKVQDYFDNFAIHQVNILVCGAETVVPTADALEYNLNYRPGSNN